MKKPQTNDYYNNYKNSKKHLNIVNQIIDQIINLNPLPEHKNTFETFLPDVIETLKGLKESDGFKQMFATYSSDFSPSIRLPLSIYSEGRYGIQPCLENLLNILEVYNADKRFSNSRFPNNDHRFMCLVEDIYSFYQYYYQGHYAYKCEFEKHR